MLIGGGVVEGARGHFVNATVVSIDASADIVKEELFAPVLYVMKFKVQMFL